MRNKSLDARPYATAELMVMLTLSLDAASKTFNLSVGVDDQQSKPEVKA